MAQQMKPVQYYDSNKIPYSLDVGANILQMLNGVKHSLTDMSPDFSHFHPDVNMDILRAVTEGEIGPTSEIRAALENHGPLRIRDLYPAEFKERFPIIDDTNKGVIIYTAEQRKETERDSFRGPTGSKVKFYTYADTAMSKTSLFRPEWIKEHYYHDGLGTDLIKEAYNNGHFEYQMTRFFDYTNFHRKSNENNQKVWSMKDGDANFITPFVPHTFTTRKEGEGLILAVTYGGAIATEKFKSKIQSMSIDEFLEYAFKNMPSIEYELATDEHEGVMVRRIEDAPIEENEAYSITTLMDGIPFQPHTKALEYRVKKGSQDKTLDIKVDAERWGYNLGKSVLLLWENQEDELKTGDSYFIQSNVSHSIRNLNGKEGDVVVMQIKPELGDPFEELALIYKHAGQEGLRRIHKETKQWFSNS